MNSTQTQTQTQTRARRRRRRILLGSAFFVVVALVAASTWVLQQRTKATPFRLDAALAELHRGEDVARDLVAPPSTAATSSVDASGAAPGARNSGGSVAAVLEPGIGVGMAAPTRGGSEFRRPTTGVYTYRTTGGDELSMLRARHDYPAKTHAIVTNGGGCRWHLEQRIVQEHVDSYDWCSSSSGLQLLTLRHDVEFFEQRDNIEYQCPADGRFVGPTDAVGAVHRTVCSSAAGDELDMTVTVTGRGTRTVDNTTVAAIAYRADFRMTGKATGRARWDGIVDAATGLRLHEHRTVSTRAHATFGDVHYKEHVTFDLVSLSPTQ